MNSDAERIEAVIARRAGASFYLLDPGGWWQVLIRLQVDLDRDSPWPERVHADYAALLRSLAEAGLADLTSAAAATLLWTENAVSESLRAAGTEPVPAGLRTALRHDLSRMQRAIGRSWTLDAQRAVGDDLPPLTDLAPPVAPEASAFADALGLATEALLERLLERYRRHGAGPLTRHSAFRWTGATLEPVPDPELSGGASLVGVDAQLERLAANTERFLAGRPAQHTLLYGPRGSGKSTAIRHQLGRYREQGLRLIEMPVGRLNDLPTLLGRLAGRPHRYLLFVDDLTFEADDASYRPLRTLLEGSLAARLENALVYATSNRRHLVRERFSDRPDPLDDDVHAWDTLHERLALADRFGLVITFPDANQRRYLTIVEELAGLEGLVEPGGSVLGGLSERAIRYADWGNGYSGRTARQFIDLLRAERG